MVMIQSVPATMIPPQEHTRVVLEVKVVLSVHSKQ